jgi:WD40 repeat protein
METPSLSLLEQYEPQEIGMIAVEPQINEARLSPCGMLLAGAGYDARVRIFKVAGKESVERDAISGHNGWVQSVAFLPTGSLASNVVFSADSWGQLRATRLTADATEPMWHRLDAHDGWIRQIDVSPDGSVLASIATDRRMAIWNSKDGTLMKEIKDLPEDMQAVRFHPGGKILATGDAKGKVSLWDVSSGEKIRELDASELWLLHRLQDVGGVRVLRFNHDGSQIACGGVKPANGATVQGEPTLLIFDVGSGEKKFSLNFGEQKDCFLLDLHWSADQVLMAVTCGTPGTGKVVFRKPDEEKAFYESTKLPNCQSLSFHTPSRTLSVMTTNRDSNGNGRRLDKEGAYLGNNSPIHLFHLGKVT